jgi:N6-adenosine-specific RNA methylase IME4
MELRIDPIFREHIFPLNDEEKNILREMVITDGIRDALVVWKETGILLDGHHRYEIAQEHGLEFRVEEKSFETQEEALDWVEANQLGRRNLTPDAFRLYLGRRYNRAKKAHGGDRRSEEVSSDQIDHLKTAEKLAAEHGVGQATVRRAGKFAEEVDETPELQQAINERKPVSQAKREVRKREITDKGPLSPPTGKYRIIYADPPWRYNDQLVEGYGPAENHYATMSIEELCALPVGDLAEDDAVLFLWVTSPFLEDAFRIIKAWDFKYKTSFIWDKVKHNYGHYNSVRHELLLVCTRGSCVPDVPTLYDSVQTIERQKHSKKPEEFRKIIDTLYTHGQRIELFARERVEKWEAWGNELPTAD